MRSRGWRHLAAAVAALAVLVAAGCGGGERPAGGVDGGAALVPAGSVAFLSVRTDRQSAQWQALAALLERLPAGAGALEALQPLWGALGPETGLVVLPPAREGRAEVIVLTSPAEPAVLEEQLAKAGGRIAWRSESGWYVIGESRAAVDAALAGASEAPLSQSEAYQTAVAGLPADSVATLYASATIAQLPERGPLLSALGSMFGSDPGVIGLAAIAEPQGLRLVGVAEPGSAPVPSPATARLLATAPADVLAYASVPSLEPVLERLAGAGAEGPVGAALGELLGPLAGGEHALYVRPGEERPELTLLLAPEDPQAAAAALERVVSSLDLLATLAGGEAPALSADPVTVGGIAATRINLGHAALFAARVGAHVVLTNAERGIVDLAADGPRLAAAPRFLEAVSAAGMPAATNGFAWVDLAGALELQPAHGASELAAGASRLAGLDYLLVYATPGAGESVSLAGFLGID